MSFGKSPEGARRVSSNGVGELSPGARMLSPDELRAALGLAGETFEHIERETTDCDVVVIARNAARAIRALLEPR